MLREPADSRRASLRHARLCAQLRCRSYREPGGNAGGSGSVFRLTHHVSVSPAFTMPHGPATQIGQNVAHCRRAGTRHREISQITTLMHTAVAQVPHNAQICLGIPVGAQPHRAARPSSPAARARTKVPAPRVLEGRGRAHRARRTSWPGRHCRAARRTRVWRADRRRALDVQPRAHVHDLSPRPASTATWDPPCGQVSRASRSVGIGSQAAWSVAVGGAGPVRCPG